MGTTGRFDSLWGLICCIRRAIWFWTVDEEEEEEDDDIIIEKDVRAIFWGEIRKDGQVAASHCWLMRVPRLLSSGGRHLHSTRVACSSLSL